MGAIESNLYADRISWRSDQPVWLNQWPLTTEKLQALQDLVQEQFSLGHLEESSSPWNTPVFVIKKKSGKWRLLQDLRAVNSTMHDMGALQPGLPSPVAVPKDWEVIVIDLQDCFFNIKLHPDDCKRFAFSVPSVNYQRPYQRYQWKVLPQGMKNSPTLCQKFVDRAIDKVRQEFTDAYIIHYMDDILLAHPSRKQVDLLLVETIKALNYFGLIVSAEKIQKYDNLKYLGTNIQGNVISFQKIQIRVDKLRTLNDFQKLLGNINWIRPYLKITTGELRPLFEILNGDSNPISIRKLTPEACAALQKVNEKLTLARVQRLNPKERWSLCILKTGYTPTACLWQQGIIEWLHLPHLSTKSIMPYEMLCAKLIIRGRHRSKELFGRDMHEIVIPYNKIQFEQILKENDDWGIALLGYLGEIVFHLPKDPLLSFILETDVIFPQGFSSEPLKEGLIIFTDGSSNGKSVACIQNREPVIRENPQHSAQQAEIEAVIIAFEEVKQAFNLFTDSKYVVSLFPGIETAVLSPKTKIYKKLLQLQRLIHLRQNKYHVGHIRGHSGLPGPLSQGNAYADSLTRVFSTIEIAQQSHALHHQNAAALRFQYHITREQAREIVKTCPHCPEWGHAPKAGVNPRGLKPCSLWQMDVTHVPEFGKLSYVHVTVDTFSHVTFATARSGEAVKDVLQHLIQSFSFMGIPKKIKTDNAPAYVSKTMKDFYRQWGIEHVTGIPYNPQGQAIVERTHQNIKAQIQKLKSAGKYFSAHHLLSHALFVLNHVNTDNQGLSAAERHWGGIQNAPKPLVRWKDLLTGTWKGPDALIASGRGYACVFPQDAESPIWVPDRLIRPYNEQRGPATAAEETAPQENEKADQEDSGRDHHSSNITTKESNLDTVKGADQTS